MTAAESPTWQAVTDNDAHPPRWNASTLAELLVRSTEWKDSHVDAGHFAAIGAIAGAIAGLLLYFATRASVSTTLRIFHTQTYRQEQILRADLIRKLTADFYTDDSISATFNDIDEGTYSFDVKQDLNGPKERKLIRFLDFFNTLGYYLSQEVLSVEDIAHTTLGYAAVRVHANEDVRLYIEHVKKWDEDRSYPLSAFGYISRLTTALATKERMEK